jgi:1-acyl-sn-glycerol-3-phosphate acyltransferase
MNVEPIIPMLRIDHFVPVLRAIEDQALVRGVVTRPAVAEVLARVRDGVRSVASDIVEGAALIEDPAHRAAALAAADHLDAAVRAASTGRDALSSAPWAAPWRPLHARAGHAVPGVARTREELERGVALLQGVPEVGVPTLRQPTTEQARDAARLIAERRAAVLEDLGPELTAAERATIDDRPAFGPFRRALASDRMARLLNVDVIGAEHVPRGTNAVLAPVHAGSWDLVHAHLGHDVPHRIMAADFLWKIPGLGPALGKLGAFPVTQGASAPALRIATGALADGQSMLIYPSGTIPLVAPAMPSRRGAAVLAIRTGTPMVPAGEYGTAPAFAYGSNWAERLVTGPRPRGAVVVGEPIPTHHLDVDDPRDVLALTAEVDRRQRELSAIAREHVERGARAGGGVS